MPKMPLKNIISIIAILIALPLAFSIAGCDDDDDTVADAGDAGDVDDDGGPSPAATCIECHLDKEKLLASLEIDPLPEEEEEEESTGEG